jgi:hypothetical protein
MTRTKTITIAAGTVAVMALAGATLRALSSAPTAGHAGLAREPIAQAGGRDFTPGARWAYAIEARSTMSLAAPDGPRGFTVELTGRWELTVVGSDGERVELRGVLRDPKLQTRADGTGGAAPAVAPDPLDAPAYLVARRDGRIEEVYVDAAAPPLARDLLRSLALATQVVVPGDRARAWTVEERDGVGEYLASYAREGDVVTKAKDRYRAGAAELARRDVAIDSATRYRLGQDGWPQVVDADETLRVAAADAMPAVTIRSSQRLRLSRTDRDAGAIGAFRRARPGLVAATARGAAAPDGAGAPDDRRTLAGATYPELLEALRAAAEPDADPRARGSLMAKLVALFRLDPGAHEEAIAEIRGGAGEPLAAGLLAALGAAGTPEAQAAVREVLGDGDVEPAVRAHAAIALGMTPSPDAETVSALDRSTRGDDPQARHVAELALGNTAHRTGDAALRTRAVERLLELWVAAATPDDQVIALEALGNTGDPRILEVVRGALAAPHDRVRASAARALRFVPHPAADQLLGTALASDAAAPVRIAAVDAAGYRVLAPLLSALGASLERDPDEAVRVSVVLRLGGRLRDTAAVRPLLERASRHDRAEAVREAAQRALAAS